MTIDFAVPQWFALSLLLPFLVGLKWWARSRATTAVDRIVAPRLQPLLVKRVSWWADWIGFSLQLLALLAFITALARPQWGFHQIEATTAERNVFIAIDTSRSMLAEDVQPNRLARAKLLSQDLVQSLPADRIGVIAFAGKAFIQAPLTVDHEAVLETLGQLDAEVIPRGGTNLAEPVLLALDSMRKAETSLAAMILFSDGEDLEGQRTKEPLAKELESSRLLIISVGAGSAAGGIIPDPDNPGQFIKDESGQIVRSRLNPASLRELSDMSGGSYVDMGSEGSITAIVQQALRKLETQRLRSEDVRVPHERYAIPLAAGMILLLFSHLWPLLQGAAPVRNRAPGTIALLLAGLLSAICPAPTARAESLQSGLQAYRTGAFAEAQERFTAALAKTPLALLRDHCEFGIGAAAYRGGDFETAKEAFSQALLTRDRSLQAKAHYNLANSLFQSGKLHAAASSRDDAQKHWKSSLAHYEAALHLNPEDVGAKTNHAFVQKLLDELEKQPPPKKEPKPDDMKGEEPKQPETPPDPKKDKEQDQNKPKEEQPKPEPPKNPGEENQPPEPPEDSPPPPKPREWTPSQARQILEQNSGEDLKAKPAQTTPSPAVPFKNW